MEEPTPQQARILDRLASRQEQYLRDLEEVTPEDEVEFPLEEIGKVVIGGSAGEEVPELGGRW